MSLPRIVVVLSLLLLTACQQMGATEVGVKFRRLPSNLGPVDIGGISSSLIRPGETAILMPWDTVYKFDTSVQDISWPSLPTETDRHESYVHTRALDGNEVALAVTVRYSIIPEAASLAKIAQEVATSNEEVRQLVASVARADIRTYFNELRTSEFLNEVSRYQARDKVEQSMSRRLADYGIKVERVILVDFRFERLLADGSVDDSYQDRLTEIQKLTQDTEREKSRIDTVKAKKQQEYNQIQAEVNRQVAEADGYKNQAISRGDAYFTAHQNQALGISAQGKAEVEGINQQVQALSGPGGLAIVKLQIAKQIQKAKPRFIIVDQGANANGINVQRLDTNELLKQIGLNEALQQSMQAPSEDKATAPAQKQIKK